MNWEIIFLLTGLMLFAYWLNYIFGSPMADDDKIDTRAIMFKFPRMLAARRLKKLGIYDEIKSNHWESMNITKDVTLRHKLKYDFRRETYIAGKEFFTWERSILCPICFHWWISLLAGVLLLVFDSMHAREDFLFAGFVYLVNHLLIRKIS